MQRELTNQDINMKSRKKINLTGIKKINSLNNEEFIVETSLGVLQICGENLEMIQLEIDKGLLEINGRIDKIEYIEEVKKEKKKIFRNLFKWYIHWDKKFL